MGSAKYTVVVLGSKYMVFYFFGHPQGEGIDTSRNSDMFEIISILLC
jgi:hypothetical protein